MFESVMHAYHRAQEQSAQPARMDRWRRYSCMSANTQRTNAPAKTMLGQPRPGSATETKKIVKEELVDTNHSMDLEDARLRL